MKTFEVVPYEKVLLTYNDALKVVRGVSIKKLWKGLYGKGRNNRNN